MWEAYEASLLGLCNLSKSGNSSAGKLQLSAKFGINSQNKMEYVNVFLYYGGKWDELNNYNDYSVSGILVPMECTYSKLVEMIVEELNWDPTKDAVSLQYQVNKNMPPIKIYNDHSISFYLELKKKDQDVTKYPLCVDVGPVSQDMEHISVLVYYGGKWDRFNNYSDYSATGILFPRECTYIKFVEMIVRDKLGHNKRCNKNTVSS
ncbi:Protein TPX2 [Olea europaea subsp. europaea]|uniref:Protein TPX2 n=1 Tax=Olea europaea subsp. europaea TaxID=158383 RepID=A0A8S0PSE0_OLEEU|nr:Protein TPX2 [Olea europaea subsp. europaea]